MRDLIVCKTADGGIEVTDPIGSMEDALKDLYVILTENCEVQGQPFHSGMEVSRRIAEQGGASFEEKTYRIVPEGNFPADDTFRGAWTDDNPGAIIDVDLPKAKLIAHGIRRTKRAERFAPHDEVIAKQIPGNDAAQAEADRQIIRDEDEILQTGIDAADSPEKLKELLAL